ncbi:MAG: response regulator transcription factor [Oscillospiraceae bacterium]|nr:response regulator transcription factor [Oscillospiraceae bacterium]
MYHILIADDEERIREMIRKYACYEGHKVTEAQDGRQAVELCRANRYDLIIMDVMMPELDGFSACREIRSFSETPVLMLSARGEEYDRIHGFEVGVDDYVVKPFSPKELMMRIEAIIKRSRMGAPDTSETLTVGQLHINFLARTVDIAGKRVELSPRGYELLFYMARNRNLALSREKLITEVWGYDFYGDERTLDTHIKLLRKQLGEYSRLIVTLRGVGYRFETP